jgi:hypothetical protein
MEATTMLVEHWNTLLHAYKEAHHTESHSSLEDLGNG